LDIPQLYRYCPEAIIGTGYTVTEQRDVWMKGAYNVEGLVTGK
jgi:hypothetical protein